MNLGTVIGLILGLVLMGAASFLASVGANVPMSALDDQSVF